MTGLPQTATGRIAFAIALSAALHLVFLFVPMVQLPPREILLPPLVAKLEPLPKISKKAAPRKKPKAKPTPAAPQPAPVVPQPEPVAPQPTTPPPDELQPASAPLATDQPASGVPGTGDAAKTAEENKPAHPLPKHAQLDFIAYKGTNFKVGEAHHRLEIGADSAYTLEVSVYTTGIAKFFKTFEMSQRSIGTLTAQGLRPDVFSETRNTAKGSVSVEARFDWNEKSLSFSNGLSTALPEQALDMLSVMYQLSQLPLDQGIISLRISNGKKLEYYELSVGEVQEIDSGLGRIRALPLRKLHAPDEDDLEFWLGVEYRLLPVKVVQYDRDGEIIGEMVISSIRLADE